MQDEITNNKALRSPESSETLIRRKLKAILINDDSHVSQAPVEKQDGKEVNSSKQVEEEFSKLVASGQAIDPPFDLFVLTTMSEYNSEMGPCIDAMKTNIDGFGHRLVYRGDPKELEADKALAKKVLAERVRLENFFLYAGLEESFTKIRKRMRSDLEKTGNAYWEVVRGPTGDIQYFVPIKAYQVRLTNRDKEPTEVNFSIIKIDADGKSVTNSSFKVRTYFRRYVQISALSYGSKKSWFKQFGDPRVLDRETGQFVSSDKVDRFGDTGRPMPESRKANEIIHWKMNDDRSPYGLPRWIGVFIDILGDRKASEINYITFCNNNVPSLIVSVSNGQLTQDTVERIKDFFEKVQGDDNRSKALVLEAEPTDEDEGEDAGAIKIEVKTLKEAQHDDAMFQNYSKENKEKVRVAWRLPPIFTGRAQDYTRTCYSSDTETLTDSGWKRYSEIKDGERIATLEPKSGELIYQEPIGGILLHDYSGPMVGFKNRNVDILVTPDHKMWVGNIKTSEFSKIEAEAISFRRFLFQNAPQKYIGDDYDEDDNGIVLDEDILKGGPNAGVMDKVIIPGDLAARFIAAFVADGSTTPEYVRGKRRHIYNVVIAAQKQRKIELFRKIFDELSNLGLRVCKESIEENDKHVFCIMDKRLWGWLRANCGTCAANKHLPDNLVYDRRYLQVVFDTLISTDGTIDTREGRTSMSYSTSSKVLADQMQIISLHLGARTSVARTYNEPPHLDNYRVLIVPNKPFHRVIQDDSYTIDYEGKVYCFEVPNHLFFVRRNGKVTIQGNTAETSRALADEQVYAPERDDFDDWVNRILFPRMDVLYHRFKSNSPNTTDNSELTKILSGAERTGGITPRIARKVLEDILGIDLPPFPDDFNPDIPFSLTMAEAVKNMGNPVEPGQSVTALKGLESVMKLSSGTHPLIEALMTIRKGFEEEWLREVSENEND